MAVYPSTFPRGYAASPDWSAEVAHPSGAGQGAASAPTGGTGNANPAFAGTNSANMVPAGMSGTNMANVGTNSINMAPAGTNSINTAPAGMNSMNTAGMSSASPAPAADTGNWLLGNASADREERGTSWMPGGDMATIGSDIENNLPPLEIGAPDSLEEVFRGSMKALLMRNIGNYVVATFLIGTQGTVSWEGILYDVGNDYLAIYQTGRDQYIVSDLYSLKYVEFYDTRRRQLCDSLLEEQAGQRWNTPETGAGPQQPGQRIAAARFS